MVNKVIKLLILFSPISYFNGMDLGRFDLIFFELGAMLLFAVSLLEGSNRDKNIFPFAIVLILAGIGCVANSFNVILMTNLINLFLGVMIVQIVANSEIEVKSLKKYILFAVGINILVFWGQMVGWSPILTVSKAGQEGGIMGNSQRLVDYLAITLAFMSPLMLFIAGMVALMSKQLALFVILGVILALRYGNVAKIVVLGAFVACCVFFWGHIGGSVSTRLDIWKATIETLLSNPLLGCGLGIFPHISSQFVRPDGGVTQYTYNSYLNLIFGVGVLTVWPLWLVISRFFKNFNISEIHLCILSILLLSLFEYPFEIPRLWITLAVLIGVYFKQEVQRES